MNEFSHEHHIEQARTAAIRLSPPRIDPAALVKRFELRNFCVPDARFDFFWNEWGEGLPASFRRDRMARSATGGMRQRMLVIELSMRAPDRDTGGSIILTFVASLSAQELCFRRDTPDELIVATVRNLVRTALLHEADEALHVAGVRLFDPHAHEERQ